LIAGVTVALIDFRGRNVLRSLNAWNFRGRLEWLAEAGIPHLEATGVNELRLHLDRF
jgi:hypothetical protein